MNCYTVSALTLTRAQLGGEATLPCGSILVAEKAPWGEWKYSVIWEKSGMVGRIVYAGDGLDAARAALNAPEVEA